MAAGFHTWHDLALVCFCAVQFVTAETSRPKPFETCRCTCLSDTAAEFETDTMSCLGLLKKKRLRSEVRVDEVHLNEIAYSMNVS